MHCWNLQHWFGDHGLKVNMSWYSDLCRHGPVILFYIWKPIWHMNIISPDYEMVWHNDSPQYSMTYMSWFSDFYLHGPVILSYIWKPIWHMNIISPDYEMVWHNDSPQYSMTYMSWFSDFYLHGPVILSYIWKPIWHMNIISPDYKMVWHNDSPQYERSQHNLHVMVQWFLPSWSSDFVLYLKAHLTYEHHKPIWHMNIISSDYEMLWHSVWPQYECRSLWPIFHGPVILLYIWKTIWHMNIILPDYEMVWPDNSPQYECMSLFIYCN